MQAGPAGRGREVPLGLTLVEILIVLAMIGILTRAISANHDFIITFTPPNIYETHSDDDNDGVRDTGEEVKQVTLETGVQFGANSGIKDVDNNAISTNGLQGGADNKLSFNSRGVASESGSAYLIPSNDLSSPTRNDRAMAVSVLQTTGRVKVWKYNADAANPGPWE